MNTSRQQVFEYIRTQRSVTAADLSRALGMTPANARHHLRILQELGLVETSTIKNQDQKGRPARIYRLSDKIVGDNIGFLSSVLLEELTNQTPVENMPVLIKKIAKTIAGLGHDERQPPKSQATRLFNAIQRLNQMHYQARWEAWSNAPRLVFYNCPYRKIVDRSPMVCEIDAALIQELVGLPADRKDKLLQDSRGGIVCIFRLGTDREIRQIPA